MAVIAYNKFSGEIPNIDPQLLPIDAAQLAQDCEFTGGSLKPIKVPFALQTMLNNPVRGIYTEDGIKFFTWATEAYAFRSPVIDEIYNRVYFLQPGGYLKIALKTDMAYNGPSPQAAATWNAGVPRPTVAPVLSLIDRSTMRDYPSASVSCTAWWEYAGKTYDSATVYPSTQKAFRSYIISAPGKAETTPEGATLAANFKIVDPSAGNILNIVLRENSSVPSSSLPGGVEVSLVIDPSSGGYQINLNWGVSETRAYAFTCTNTWDEESAPSPASTVSVTYMQDVLVRASMPSFTGYRPQSGVNVYRTVGTGVSYLKTEVSGSVDSGYVDSSGGSRSIGKALESTNWTPPPVGMKGLDISPNGWFVGFSGNTLYMSEPYRPHAWPYSITFSQLIRGIKVGQQAVVVTTADGVYVVPGAFPASAQAVRVNLPQPGISNIGMGVVDGAVVYASNDGMAFVNGAQGSMSLSQKLFTRAKWQDFWAGLNASNVYVNALRDGSLQFAFHDGCLVATSKSLGKGFTLRFDEAAIGQLSRLSTGYDAMFYLPVADSLYVGDGSTVSQFKGGGSAETMVWHGRDWVFSYHATFGAGYIRCSGPTKLEVFADGVLVHTKTDLKTGHFRLPSLPRALRWSVRLSGAFEVFEFAMAGSMAELKSV